MIENHKAIVVALKNVRPHSNADRLKLATVCGCQIIVGINNNEGELGVFFPEGVRLSEEFATINDLIRRKDDQGRPAGGMFDKNCRVRCQSFRGEKSEGFWIPVASLKYTGVKPTEGDAFDTLNGKEICRKYIPRHNPASTAKKRTRGQTLMFNKHFDTHQLRVNYDSIPTNKLVVVTLKVHGTSQRVGRVLEPKRGNWLQKAWWSITGNTYSWQYLVGTRNVICGNEGGNPYHSQSFRDRAAAPFVDNLRKGEVVYYEVVGYEDADKPIMPGSDTNELSKESQKLYGKRVEYTYGCSGLSTEKDPHGQFDIYVYRITMVNEDGNSYDLIWEDVKSRCDQLGVKHAIEMDQFIINDRFGSIDKFREYVETVTEGQDLVCPNQPREGVCVRVEGNPIKIFKNKSFDFKTLEGINTQITIEDQS